MNVRTVIIGGGLAGARVAQAYGPAAGEQLFTLIEGHLNR